MSWRECGAACRGSKTLAQRWVPCRMAQHQGKQTVVPTPACRVPHAAAGCCQLTCPAFPWSDLQHAPPALAACRCAGRCSGACQGRRRRSTPAQHGPGLACRLRKCQGGPRLRPVQASCVALSGSALAMCRVQSHAQQLHTRQTGGPAHCLIPTTTDRFAKSCTLLVLAVHAWPACHVMGSRGHWRQEQRVARMVANGLHSLSTCAGGHEHCPGAADSLSSSHGSCPFCPGSHH